LKLTR